MEVTKEARDTWYALTKCESDKYFGTRTKMDKELEVLAAFEASIRATANAETAALRAELQARVDGLTQERDFHRESSELTAALIVEFLRADAKSWKIEGNNPVACMAIHKAADAVERGEYLQALKVQS